MAVYAIGDIQGCFDELRRLLDRLNFDPAADRLWLVGDLVNRGPKSLDTLRYVKALRQAAVTVLGNHDLNLLAKYVGAKPNKAGSSLDAVLSAPDCDELVDWLRHRCLLHHDPQLGFTMGHAGLVPQWNLEQALALAGEVQAVLRGSDYVEFLYHMYGDEPDRWSEELRGWGRLRFIVNAFTRLRYCDRDGRINIGLTGPPGTQPKGFMPWFEVPGRKSADLHIVCGHWSTLGYRKEPGVIALDSGCVWGGQLTAVRLDGQGNPITALECLGAATPR